MAASTKVRWNLDMGDILVCFLGLADQDIQDIQGSSYFNGYAVIQGIHHIRPFSNNFGLSASRYSDREESGKHAQRRPEH